MRKTSEFFTNYFKVFLILYIVIQFLLLLFLPVTFKSDSQNYYQLAEQCIKLHSFYPATPQIYNDYIRAPLYENYLILILSVYNSKITIAVFNILLNLLQLFFVYKISERIFNKNSAKMAGIIYIFYLSSLGLVFMNMTELMFGSLVLGSIYFYLKKDTLSYFISGLFAGAAIGVRPFGWILGLIYLVFLVYKARKSKQYNSAISLAGIILFVFVFGVLTDSYFGHFIFTSNNGPVNIIIGANNNATGAYNETVFKKGKIGYIDSAKYKTYLEKESFWRNQAEKWILKHPFHWLSLFPMKLVHMFVWDDFSVHKLANADDWSLYKVVKTFITTKSLSDELEGVPLANKILFIIIQIYHHIYYFSVLVIFILMLVKKNNFLFSNEGIVLMLLFILLGLMINLLTFGNARFKYPYVIMMIIMISSPVFNFIESKNFYFHNRKTLADV